MNFRSGFCGRHRLYAIATVRYNDKTPSGLSSHKLGAFANSRGQWLGGKGVCLAVFEQ